MKAKDEGGRRKDEVSSKASDPPSSFIPHPSSLRSARLLVVGDVMLDRYWFGEVSRISPEAPVPVVKVGRTEERLGGAANVARNIVAVGAQASLLSVVGQDEAGDCLQRLLESVGITAQLHRDPGLATTIKLRVIGRQQQLLRIDFETEPGHEVLMSKLADFREVAGRWKSEDDLTERAQIMRRELGLDALLVTRSEEGMTLYRDQQRLHVPAVAREVYDVSGAGDTVIAVLGVMLAAGAGFAEAVQFANKAAGIVVGKLGTAVVHPEELFEEQG